MRPRLCVASVGEAPGKCALTARLTKEPTFFSSFFSFQMPVLSDMVLDGVYSVELGWVTNTR